VKTDGETLELIGVRITAVRRKTIGAASAGTAYEQF
jgi:hypothetical protein